MYCLQKYENSPQYLIIIRYNVLSLPMGGRGRKNWAKFNLFILWSSYILGKKNLFIDSYLLMDDCAHNDYSFMMEMILLFSSVAVYLISDASLAQSFYMNGGYFQLKTVHNPFQ